MRWATLQRLKELFDLAFALALLAIVCRGG